MEATSSRGSNVTRGGFDLPEPEIGELRIDEGEPGVPILGDLRPDQRVEDLLAAHGLARRVDAVEHVLERIYFGVLDDIKA